MGRRVIEVAAGLIYEKGRYLIARRKPGVHLAGYWEFPGGKRESGESFEECLRRELFEELSIRVDAPVPYQIVRHDYDETTVELHFFHCRIEEGQATNLDSSEIRWVAPQELPHYAFPPADGVIIESLQCDAGRYPV